jgi:MOSC domain-containing protein YiiM
VIRILSVNTGTARILQVGGRTVTSAIAKRPIAGPVAVGPLGLAGDEQADLTVHGGLDKAVYVYPAVHYAFWQTVRAQARVAGPQDELPPGSMGENLTIEGVDETGLWIGDRLEWPGCTLAVSAPRTPCDKFAAVMGFAQAVKLMLQSGYCGAYLSVIEPGHVRTGDIATLRPGPREVNVRELFKMRARGS